MSEWETDGVEEMCLEALELLGADEVEVEVSVLYAPVYLEAADREEVLPIDTRDPAGGFGGVDLWLATLVPLFAAAKGRLKEGPLDAVVLDELIEVFLQESCSPRARRRKEELSRVVRTVLDLEGAS